MTYDEIKAIGELIYEHDTYEGFAWVGSSEIWAVPVKDGKIKYVWHIERNNYYRYQGEEKETYAFGTTSKIKPEEAKKYIEKNSANEFERMIIGIDEDPYDYSI